MDKIHRYWIVFGLMALYVLPATGQDCESLKNKLLETGRSWSIEKGFRVEYEITSFFGDGETQSTVQNIMALGRGDRSYLKADQLEVLKDKSTAVNLVHNRKTVFIADASDPLYRQIADMIVSTERRGTSSVVKEIRRRLENETV